MVSGGITDVFLSNEIVSHQKINRLVALAAQGDHHNTHIITRYVDDLPFICIGLLLSSALAGSSR